MLAPSTRRLALVSSWAAATSLLATHAFAAAPVVTHGLLAKLRPDIDNTVVTYFGTGLLPQGLNCTVLTQHTHAYARIGGTNDWSEAEIQFPSTAGCGATAMTIRHQLSLPLGGGALQIKFVVDGVSSNVFNHPVLAMPAAAKPQITSLEPAKALAGQAGKVSVKVKGTGIEGQTKAKFQGKPVYGYQSPSEFGWVQIDVPQDALAKAGRYSVQLENAQGYSNLVWFDVVAKPTITKVEPAVVSNAAFASGAPALGAKVWFGGSPPDHVQIKLDGTTVDATFAEKMGYVDVSLPLAGHPVPANGRVVLRFSNIAGDHTFDLGIAAKPVSAVAAGGSGSSKKKKP